MRTLDLPRIIALLKPLTGHADVALRLVGVNDAADARIISGSLLQADGHFVPLWVECYVTALPPSHPLTLKDRLRSSDFAGIAMIDRCHCEQSAFFKGAQPRQTVAIARRGPPPTRCKSSCPAFASNGRSPAEPTVKRERTREEAPRLKTLSDHQSN